MTSSLGLPEEHGRRGSKLDGRATHFDTRFRHHPKPEVSDHPESMREMAYGLIRVLNDEGVAQGDWSLNLSEEVLISGLTSMMLTRAYDERMFKLQRQGKLSFYLKCRGEEAVAVAQAMALNNDDMLFPSYRQQGLFITRGKPITDMMNQCLSNAADELDGKQLPILYSWADGNIFSISGNVATEFCQGVGWAMASAIKGESRIAASWVGEGGTAEADVHHAMQFAATWRAPVLLNIVNNQWAISTPYTFASCGTTFAARGIGYNLPSLRVDGNDFLAVYSVTQWAAERARSGHGAAVIELLTRREEGHSSSDDPSAYREPQTAWPLGDPIERLKQHLMVLGCWSEEQHQELEAKLTADVLAASKSAEGNGSLLGGKLPSRHSLFEQVYAETPEHLLRQRDGAF